MTAIAMVATMIAPAYAAEHDHEYEYDSSGINIDAKVIAPSIRGHLSICIEADTFTQCREIEGSDKRVVLQELTAGVYHIDKGESFEVCATLYPDDSNTPYHSCSPAINHANGYHEFVVIELVKGCS